MRKLFYIVLIFFSILDYCFGQISNKTVDTSKIAVLTTEKYRGFKNFKSTVLSDQEIIYAEKLLSRKVKKYNKKNPFELIKLERYHRQYVGAINKKGEKVIFINCFCENPAINWRDVLNEVADGGNCFFSLDVNITKKKAEEIIANGP